MDNRTIPFLDKLIWLTLVSLAIIVPLIFTTANTELFEVPKMFIVYCGSLIVLIATILKFIILGKIQIPQSVVFYSLLAFVAIQIVSTLTSIDQFTSIYGYPTRLNGGLLSQFAYLIIFSCALINLNAQKAQRLLLTMIVTAFAVALWGIPGHFGADPNCLILTGNLNASCWQKEFDPTVRIFSTLGQPNWLASFIVLILPFAASLFFVIKNKILPIIICTALVFALFFTGSTSGALGFLTSIIIFSFLYLKKDLKVLGAFLALLIAVSAFFGPTIKNKITESLTQTQKANAGTPSGQIRLIVWQGALAAFKTKPVLGSGPETFIYSYYKYKPPAHNQTTEWNFYYNKAHNEFLNYLANVGILGFGAYLAFLGTSLFTLFKISLAKNTASVWSKAAIAGIAGYLVTIFFGFSIVATQLFMFLGLAVVLILAGVKTKDIPIKPPMLRKIAFLFTLIFGLWLLVLVLRLYFADVLISRAKDHGRLSAFGSAVTVSPAANPFYLADYAYTLAVYANSQKKADLAKILEDQSAVAGQKALETSPYNLLVLNKVINAFDELASKDATYKIKVLELNKKAVSLAPTDPTPYLNLAKTQRDIGQIKEAQKSAETALQLKPDYQEALDLLDQIQGKKLQ